MKNKNNKTLTRSGYIAITAPFRWVIIQGIFFFAAAGHTDIPRAWLYFSVILIGTLIDTAILLKRAPELINQRGKIGEGTKTWDKLLLAIIFLNILIFIPATAGLDIGRYRLTRLGIQYAIIGIIIYTISLILTLWAMIENKFFEGTVRIQKERGHQVVSSGPYQYVRHPGYVGMVLTILSVPLILGSMYALIPAGIAILALLIRTFLEDKTLQEELVGYKEYTLKTRYRLVPGVW